MSRGFFAMDPTWWPLLLEQLRGAGPLTDEAVRADLRYLQDQALAPRGTWPSLHELADRWGWTSRTGRPAIKRVRLVLRDEQAWADPHKAEAWAAFRGAAVEEGHDGGTTRARRGHDEGTTRARRGHAADRSNLENEPAEGTARAREGHGEGTGRARRGHGKGHTRAVSTCTSTPTVTCTEGEARDARPPPIAIQVMQDDDVDLAALAWDEARRIHQEAGLGKLPAVAPPRWGFDEAVLAHGPVPVLQVVWWLCYAEGAVWYRQGSGKWRKAFGVDLDDCLVAADGWCTASGITVRLPGVSLEPAEHLPWETDHGRRMLDGQVLDPAPYAASWGAVPGGPEAARWHAALHLVGGWPAWCAVDRSDLSAVASFRASWRAAHAALGAAEAAASEWSRGERKRQLGQMVASPEWRPHGRYGMHGDPAWRRAWDIAGGSEVLDSMSMTGDGVQAFVLLWSHAWLGVRADSSASSSVPTGNHAVIEDLDEVRVREVGDVVVNLGDW